jgi:hypothetical protein
MVTITTIRSATAVCPPSVCRVATAHRYNAVASLPVCVRQETRRRVACDR